LEGIGTIDMDVDEFVGLTDIQRERAIARRETNDKRKEARIQVALENKEKKEAERVAKLAEKEKEKEKEEKAKTKGKKKEDGEGVVPTPSTVDQGPQMEAGAHSGMKRKAVLPKFTEEMVTQGTQVIAIGDDDDVTSEELVLNVSIVDVVDNEINEGPNCYTEVMDFLKKVHELYYFVI
jgi:hypothetical protein